MQVTVKERQWLGDMALEGAGSVEALFAFAQRNGLSITDDLAVGALLQFDDVLDSEVVSYYQVNEIYPATAIVVTPDNPKPGGIGYMQIGSDFKLS